MIKVCHIVNLITGKEDGVFAHLKMIFNNYSKTNYIHFVIFQGGSLVENELSNFGIKYYKVQSLSNKISANTFISIYKIIKEENPDILHTHLIKSYAIVGLLNIIFKKKLIFNYHGLFISNKFNSVLEKILYTIAHCIIALSKAVDLALVPSKRSKQLLLKETNLFPSVKVYYNGYDFSKNISSPENRIVQELNKLKSSNNKLIGFVGRISGEKRLDLILDILKLLKKKSENIYLVVFGDGELLNKFKGIAEKQNLLNNTMFLGYVKDVENYYKYLDLVLFASEWEGMPLVLWESLANGIPVVAPDVGGFSEILEKFNCGVIYESGNINEASNKIITLINDVSERKKMSKNGIDIITNNFNSTNFIMNLENTYKNLLNSDRNNLN